MRSTCPRASAWLASATLLLCLSGSPAAPAFPPPPGPAIPALAPAAIQDADLEPAEPRPLVPLRGQLLDAAGRPLANVLIEAGESEFERDEQGELLEIFEFTTVSDASGRFELDVDPVAEELGPPQYLDGPSLKFSGAGLLAVDLDLPRLPAAGLDLGPVRLSRAVPVQLSLRNVAGQPLHEGWKLDLTGTWPSVQRIYGGVMFVDGALRYSDRELGPEGLRLQVLESSRRRLRLIHVSGARAELDVDLPPWAPGINPVEAHAIYTGPDLDGLRVIRLTLGSRLVLPAGSSLAPAQVEIFGPEGPVPFAVGPDPASARPWAEARAAASVAKRRPLDFSSAPVEQIYVQGAGLGTLRLEVNDPRYVPLVQSIDASADVTEVRLEGNSSLILEVIDASSGAALPACKLSLEVGGEFESFEVLQRGSDSSTSPPGPVLAKQVVRGLPPDALVLRVGAAGFRDQEFELPAIQPGGERRLRVELQSSMAARVLVTGEPTPGDTLRLFQAWLPKEPSALGTFAYVPSGTLATEAGLFEWKPPLMLDRNGRGFSLIAADRLLRLAGPVEVPWPPETIQTIELQLEPSCTLGGALELPAELRRGRLALRLTRARIQASISLQTVNNQLEALRDFEPLFLALDESRYQLEGLAPDVYRLHPATPGSDPRAVLAEVDLSAGGAFERPLDLAAHVPAALEVLLPPGLPPVELLLAGPGREVRSGPTAAGRLSFPSLAPGRYRAALRGLAAGGMPLWIAGLSEEIELAPGAARVWRPEVALTRGRVRLLSAAGEPLRSEPLWLRFDPVQDPKGLIEESVALRSDDEGWLDLELPAGPFRLFPPGKQPPKRLGKHSLARAAALQWPADSGCELRLP